MDYRLSSSCVIFGAILLFTKLIIKVESGFFNNDSPYSNIFGRSPTKRCSCSCGLFNRREQRLIGGEITEFNEYPWVAALLYKGHFFCAGTLISDKYVLTAAHCIMGVHVSNLKILLGEHVRSFPIETRSEYYTAVYTVYHHNFNRTTYNNDIGLVKLAKPVPFKWHSRPACLPMPKTDYVGELAVVTGWGKDSESGQPSDSLHEVALPVLSNPVCKRLKYDPDEISENMLCAGAVDGGKDSCHGDSGGGLLWEGKDQKMDVIGIVSWGHGCGRVDLPGVYTRVSKYLQWIHQHTLDSCFCARRTPKG